MFWVNHALKAKPFQSLTAMPPTRLFMFEIILGVASVLGEIIDRFDDEVMGVSAATIQVIRWCLEAGVNICLRLSSRLT